MDDAAAIRALDPELVLARLRASRWALVRALLVTRVGIAAASFLLVVRPGETVDRSLRIAAAFATYLTWAVFAAIRPYAATLLIQRRPKILWIEQALCVALVILGGGVRVISLYLCAVPVIVATVLIGPRKGLVLATADAIVVAAVFGVAAATGQTIGTEPIHGTEWPPALVGLYVAVGLFAYVRRLFLELEVAGVAYGARTDEIRGAVVAEEHARTRTVALAGVVRPLEEIRVDLGQRISSLREHRQDDDAWQQECAQLVRLAARADESLAELAAYSHRDGPETATTIADVVATAVGRVRTFGIEVNVDYAGCDVTVAGSAEADALARFVEEAVWNAHKHGAPPILVRASSAAGSAQVTIADHGVGVSPSSPPGGVGLASLRRDAALLHGDLQIGPRYDAPMAVTLTIPTRGG